MGIINCKECGSLCVENLQSLCGRCRHEYLEAEIVVADYLRSHKNASLEEIHKATNIKLHTILKLIQEGRIIEGELAYSCERCGQSINSGRFCKGCEAGIVNSLKSAVNGHFFTLLDL